MTVGLPIYKQIAEVVRLRGSCTMNDVLADLPHITPQQARYNLKNAANRKLIFCAQRHVTRSNEGPQQTIWAACEGSYSPRAVPMTDYPLSFVFDMGARAQDGRPFWKARVPRSDFSTAEAE